MLCFTFASNDDSLDRKKLSVDEMHNRVIDKTQNGSIILFHNGVENTPEALDKILTKLKKDGYESVTVSELIYWDNYEIDHRGRQISSGCNFYLSGLSVGARNTTAPCGRCRECELAQRSKLCEVNSEQTILGTARVAPALGTKRHKVE